MEKYDRESRELGLENNPVWQAYKAGKIDIEGIKKGAAGQLGMGAKIGRGIGQGLSNVGDILLQQGGITPQKKAQPSQLDELIKLETLKSKREADALAQEKTMLDIEAKKAELERQRIEDERIAQAQAAMGGGATPPTVSGAVSPSPGEYTPVSATQQDEGYPQSEYEVYIDPTTGLKKQRETEESIARRGLFETKQKESVKTEMNVREKQIEEERNAVQNFGKVAGSAKELADLYASAYKEGGVGSRKKLIKSNLGLWLGGKHGEQYAETAKLIGQKGEMALGLMPILTGSVRIIKSIFNYLKKTLPEGQETPTVAAGKLRQTVKNMYRLSKAMKDLGITPDKLNSAENDEAELLGSRIVSSGMMSKYKLTDAEEEEIKTILDDITSELDAISTSEGVGSLKSKYGLE